MSHDHFSFICSSLPVQMLLLPPPPFCSAVASELEDHSTNPRHNRLDILHYTRAQIFFDSQPTPLILQVAAEINGRGILMADSKIQIWLPPSFHSSENSNHTEFSVVEESQGISSPNISQLNTEPPRCPFHSRSRTGFFHKLHISTPSQIGNRFLLKSAAKLHVSSGSLSENPLPLPSHEMHEKVR